MSEGWLRKLPVSICGLRTRSANEPFSDFRSPWQTGTADSGQFLRLISYLESAASKAPRSGAGFLECNHRLVPGGLSVIQKAERKFLLQERGYFFFLSEESPPFDSSSLQGRLGDKLCTPELNDRRMHDNRRQSSSGDRSHPLCQQ
jgi:hypothetical protein